MDTTELALDEELVVLEWRDLAACSGFDPELFFPAGETGPAVEQIRQAKRVCAGCEVVEDCLSYAVETNQVSGVWGGLTEDERRPVRRRWLAERRRRAVS
ncbi:MAG TPA: WhiB family transcriptional regulator [Acidimicrobiia bacterium]|nr:WhiB family transcriptional regulator [Acidimicrobiia bacterium]